MKATPEQEAWVNRGGYAERRIPGDRRLVLDLRNPRTGESVRETLLRVEKRSGGDRRASEER